MRACLVSLPLSLTLRACPRTCENSLLALKSGAHTHTHTRAEPLLLLMSGHSNGVSECRTCSWSARPA